MKKYQNGWGTKKEAVNAWNKRAVSLDKLSPDVNKLEEIISQSQLYSDAWKYNEMCEDDLKFLYRHKYKLAQEIINSMPLWITKRL